jgi:hypothetical protein
MIRSLFSFLNAPPLLARIGYMCVPTLHEKTHTYKMKTQRIHS